MHYIDDENDDPESVVPVSAVISRDQNGVEDEEVEEFNNSAFDGVSVADDNIQDDYQQRVLNTIDEVDNETSRITAPSVRSSQDSSRLSTFADADFVSGDEARKRIDDAERSNAERLLLMPNDRFDRSYQEKENSWEPSVPSHLAKRTSVHFQEEDEEEEEELESVGEILRGLDSTNLHNKTAENAGLKSSRTPEKNDREAENGRGDAEKQRKKAAERQRNEPEKQRTPGKKLQQTQNTSTGSVHVSTPTRSFSDKPPRPPRSTKEGAATAGKTRGGLPQLYPPIGRENTAARNSSMISLTADSPPIRPGSATFLSMDVISTPLVNGIKRDSDALHSAFPGDISAVVPEERGQTRKQQHQQQQRSKEPTTRSKPPAASSFDLRNAPPTRMEAALASPSSRYGETSTLSESAVIEFAKDQLSKKETGGAYLSDALEEYRKNYKSRAKAMRGDPAAAAAARTDEHQLSLSMTDSERGGGGARGGDVQTTHSSRSSVRGGGVVMYAAESLTERKGSSMVSSTCRSEYVPARNSTGSALQGYGSAGYGSASSIVPGPSSLSGYASTESSGRQQRVLSAADTTTGSTGSVESKKGQGANEWKCRSEQSFLAAGFVEVGSSVELTFKATIYSNDVVVVSAKLENDIQTCFKIVNGNNRKLAKGGPLEIGILFSPTAHTFYLDNLKLKIRSLGKEQSFTIPLTGSGSIAAVTLNPQRGLVSQRGTYHLTPVEGRATSFTLHNHGRRSAFVRISVDKIARLAGKVVDPSHSFVIRPGKEQRVVLSLTQLEKLLPVRADSRAASTLSMATTTTSERSTTSLSLADDNAFGVRIMWGEEKARQRLLRYETERGRCEHIEFDGEFYTDCPFYNEQPTPKDDYQYGAWDKAVFSSCLRGIRLYIARQPSFRASSSASSYANTTITGEQTMQEEDTIHETIDRRRLYINDNTVMETSLKK